MALRTEVLRGQKTSVSCERQRRLIERAKGKCVMLFFGCYFCYSFLLCIYVSIGAHWTFKMEI